MHLLKQREDSAMEAPVVLIATRVSLCGVESEEE